MKSLIAGMCYIQTNVFIHMQQLSLLVKQNQRDFALLEKIQGWGDILTGNLLQNVDLEDVKIV